LWGILWTLRLRSTPTTLTSRLGHYILKGLIARDLKGRRGVARFCEHWRGFSRQNDYSVLALLFTLSFLFTLGPISLTSAPISI
ncbi:hypothetical protein FOMPIDRAFT_1025778, partial [Fomitopsis schrenkii]